MTQRRANQPQHPTRISDFARRNGVISAWNMAAPFTDSGDFFGISPTNSPTNTVVNGLRGTQLNGSTQYWSGSEVSRYEFGSGDFLVACTFKASPFSTQVLIAFATGAGANYYIATDSSGKLKSQVNSETVVSTTSATWQDGKVHTLVFVRRAGVLEYYIDGKYDGGATSAGTLTGTTKIVLGRYGNGSSSYLNGAIFMAAIGCRAPVADACRELSRNPWRIFAGVPEDFVGKVSAGGAFSPWWAARKSRTIGSGII